MCKSSDVPLQHELLLINFVVHVIFVKLELQVLKVSRFSIGWFALTDRCVPLTRRVALTAVLHYCADCDTQIFTQRRPQTCTCLLQILTWIHRARQYRSKYSLTITGWYQIAGSTINLKFSTKKWNSSLDMPQFFLREIPSD